MPSLARSARMVTTPNSPAGPLSRHAKAVSETGLARTRVLSFSISWGAIAVVAVMSWGVVGTRALLQSATANPSSGVAAAVVRVGSDSAGSTLFDAPSMLPGESVERAVAVRNTGSVPVDIFVGTVPESGDASHLVGAVDRCVSGPWATATRPSGALEVERPLVCTAPTPGTSPEIVGGYVGALVARGPVQSGASTTTPVPQLVARAVPAGNDVHVRIRVAQPDLAGADERASVRFDWTARGVTTNLSGTPLSAGGTSAVGTAVPVTTPTGTAIPGVSPQPTLFPVPTATAVPVGEPSLGPLSGYALAFDGELDAVEIPWTTVSGLASRQAWTFETWIRPVDTSGSRVVYAESATVSGVRRAVMAVRLVEGTVQAGTWRTDRGGDGWSWSLASQGAALTIGAWHHLAVTWVDGSSVAIVIDGVANVVDGDATAGRLRGTDVSATSGLLGRAPDQTIGGGFVGALDEVRLWDGIRAPSALAVGRSLRLQGTEAGLVAYFPVGMTEGKGTTLVDGSGHDLSPTLIGGVRWVVSTVPMSGVAPVDLGTQWRAVTLTNADAVALMNVPIRLDAPLTTAGNDASTIAAWSFDETDGVSVRDSSGKLHVGTVVGAFAWAPGASGNGLALSGGGYANFGTAPAVTGTGPFTVQAWFKTSTLAPQVIVQQRSAAAANGEWVLGLDALGHVSWWSYGDGQYGFRAITTSTFADGAWHHVTATREVGGAGNIYIDGALAAQALAPARTLIPITVYVGADVRDSVSFFVGTLDDVRIVGRALTAAEASAGAVADPVGVTARITDEINRPIPFWREQAGTYWVRPSISGGASTTLRFHWGNAANSDGSDGSAVFDDFDGFSGTALDVARWQVINGADGTATVAGGRLTITAAGDWWGVSDTATSVLTRNSIASPYVAEALVSTWVGSTCRVFGVRASAAPGSAFLSLVNDGDASNASVVFRDSLGATAAWPGDNTGVPRVAIPSVARLDVAPGSVTARFGGRVAGARSVAGWDLAMPGFTASHGFTNVIDWYRVRRLPSADPAIVLGAVRANPGVGV